MLGLPLAVFEPLKGSLYFKDASVILVPNEWHLLISAAILLQFSERIKAPEPFGLLTEKVLGEA